MRKEVNFKELYPIFLTIRVVTWKLRIPLQFQSKLYRHATKPLSALLLTNTFKNMTYEEIINEVDNGARFTVDFGKRTLRLNGKTVNLSDCDFHLPAMQQGNDTIRDIETLYNLYKHSVPSERSESHRRHYFKALPEKELSDSDMMYGDRREIARLRLELYVLLRILSGELSWDAKWGSWFWQSEKDKDLVILRSWIEPEQGEA